MIYKINKENIIKNIADSFFIILFGIICQIISYYYNGFIDIIFILVIILILLLIVVFLLIDYSLFSTKQIITINDKGIEVANNDKIINQIDKTVIKKVIIFGAPSIHRNSTFRLLPFENFHYVKIIINDNESIYISSLSDYYLHLSIREHIIFKDKVIFMNNGFTKNGMFINSIWWNNLVMS